MVAINDFQIEVARMMDCQNVNVNHSNKDGTTPVYITAQTSPGRSPIRFTAMLVPTHHYMATELCP